MITKKQNIWLGQMILSVRPAQLADFIKKFLPIRRQNVQDKNGNVFYVDPASIFGIKMLRDGIFEAQKTQLVQSVLRPQDTFIDVGGNEGYFSIVASSQIQSGKIYCIEPQSRLQPIIDVNVRANEAHVIKVLQCALSSERGRVEIFTRPSTNTGASSIFQHWRFGSSSEIVQAATLDHIFAENKIGDARLIKVDCEGAEHKVVAGANRVLRQQAVDFIAMEYHPSICGTKKCHETHHKLKSAGYVLTRVSHQNVYHLPGLEGTLESLGELERNCNLNW